MTAPAREQAITQLAGGVPVTLLPVRLETRYSDDRATLRIRIYPEQIHVDAHEPDLTAGELEFARAYWVQRWAGGDAAERAAWATLTARIRPPRARWLVSATTPTNLASLGSGAPAFPDVAVRADSWTRAPIARLLPGQWVALGYRAGAEVFRAWSGPVSDPLALGLTPTSGATGTAPPDEQDELPVDDGMRWLVDYTAALTAGMAITVTDADVPDASLGAGVDELVVLGVDTAQSPADAAAALAAQLSRHAVSDGLALLRAGTPTNNTDDDRAAAGTDPLLDPGALDPADVDPDVQAEGAVIGRALGLPDASAFAGVAGSGNFADTPAADMNNVLWASTIGYFLDQLMRPLVPSAAADGVAAHFRQYVRGRGPYGTLRVGRQPYGILAILAGPLTTQDPVVGKLAQVLAGLRPFWTQAIGAVPELGNSNRPDADLVDLLRRTPRSESFRFRHATGTTTTWGISGFDATAVFQEQFALLTLGLAGIAGTPQLAQLTVAPAHSAVPAPLVGAAPLSETAPLDPNYIAAVLAQATQAGGLSRLVADPGAANSLLEALLRQSCALEYTIATSRLVITHELSTNVLTSAPAISVVPDREVFDIAAVANDDAPAASLFESADGPVQLATTSVAAISGTATLADFVASRLNADLLARPDTARFAAFRQSLDRLSAIPAAELARLAADTLDCAAHRLDAWLTSLATRQLDELRDGTGGTHVGAFGYVENLAPRTAPTSLGYLPAPSLSHAATAAILRSGYLARGADGSEALALDLSSTRVARALDLIQGSRSGQPIGALLGYRFERGLQDRRITLAEYILPFRQAAPLASAAAGQDDGTPLEAVAARDVVDGLALLQKWQADANGLYAGLSLPVAANDRADVDAVFADLRDALDAVSDVLVAESVHQAVLGNTERSAAALDALDRQSNYPEPSVVRTPRRGRGINHRLLLLAQHAPSAGWPTDPRSAAEPRLDAWAGTVLGDPARFHFAAEVHDADGSVVQRLTAGSADLRLSALGTVCACAASGAGGASEVEERLALHFADQVSAAGAARLTLLDDPPAGSPASALGLRDLLELGAQLLDLFASAAPADRRSLSPDAATTGSATRPAAGLVPAELRARADSAVQALSAAIDGLAAATTANRAARLLAVADAGVRAAVPTGGDDAALAAQAASVLSAARAALTGVQAAEAGFVRGGAEDAAVVAHDLERIRAVFGAGFSVAPTFTLDDGASIAASSTDPALLDGDPLAPASWVARYSQVRAPVARLVDVLTGAELLGGGTGLADVWAAQLPHTAGERWLGLPKAAGAAATVSIVAHSVGRPDLSKPLAGLVVDQWSDVVPVAQETTGVSFHYDAPGARSPQTIVVAVPGDAASAAWSVEALAGAVRDTIALARIRPLDGEDLDAVGRFLPAIYLPFNVDAKTPSVNLAAIIGRAITAANAVYLEQG